MASIVPDDIFARALAVLMDLCRISSPSGDLAGLRQIAERIGQELASRGLLVEINNEPDSDGVVQPVLVARGPDTGAGHLLLVGHMDTVLPAIEPVVHGDRLHGTGALDMKGGIAALLGALDLAARQGDHVPNDLMVAVVPDEEVGGSISEAAVRRWGDTARAILVIEPGERHHDESETVVAGRRGLCEWRCEATGKAAHSGLAYWDGRSATAALAEWIATAQALSERGPGSTVNVARIVGGDRDFVDDLANHHALLHTGKRRNVVSERAVAEGETRFLSPVDRDRVLGRLADLAHEVGTRHGVSISFTTGSSVPPVDPGGPGRPLVERTVRLAKERGWCIEVEQDRGGISFPNYVTDPTKVPIVDGLGPVGGGMHTREEYLDLRSLERRILLIADLLKTL